MIAVIRLDEKVDVRQFNKKGITFAGYDEDSLNGLPIGKFFKELLTHHHTACNKQVVHTALNTWYWVAVVGQNGKLRGEPKLYRHTMPQDVGGQPFWLLKVDNSHQGEYTKYVLLPLTEFECKHCGVRFERYQAQTHHNVCQECAALLEEFHKLARELNEIDDLDNPLTNRVKNIISSRMEEINEIVMN